MFVVWLLCACGALLVAAGVRLCTSHGAHFIDSTRLCPRQHDDQTGGCQPLPCSQWLQNTWIKQGYDHLNRPATNHREQETCGLLQVLLKTGPLVFATFDDQRTTCRIHAHDGRGPK